MLPIQGYRNTDYRSIIEFVYKPTGAFYPITVQEESKKLNPPLGIDTHIVNIEIKLKEVLIEKWFHKLVPFDRLTFLYTDYRFSTFGRK